MRVVAVAASGGHGFSKELRAKIQLLAGLGVEGDAHCGELVKHRYLVRKNPKAPNLCQVHLLQAELFTELAGQGIEVGPGEMGENVTVAGVDLLGLPKGARVRLGSEAVVEITGLRTPCVQMNGLRPGLMKACTGIGIGGEKVRKAGVMGVVLVGGLVRAGDAVEVEMPVRPWVKLGPV